MSTTISSDEPKKVLKRPHACVWKTFVGSKFSHIDGVTQVEDANSNNQIRQIHFQTQCSSDIQRHSVIEVGQRQFYRQNTSEPHPYGPLDARMGTSNNKTGICTTCFKPLIDCVGHFGHINLELPVFHIGYMRDIQRTLQAICKKCSNVLLPSHDHYQYYLETARASTDRRRSTKIADEILDIAKTTKCCIHCGTRNGQIKKVPGLLKFLHDLRQRETKKDREQRQEEEEQRRLKIRHRRLLQQQAERTGGQSSLGSSIGSSFGSNSNSMNDMEDNFIDAEPGTWKEELDISIRSAVRYNQEINQHKDKIILEISPLQALRLFKNIPNEQCYMLNIDPSYNRPENLILTHLAVPPTCIRPSVTMGTGTNEDDLTIKLGEIVQTNQIIRQAFQRGMLTSQIIQHWDFLQQQVAMYINSDLPGVSKTIRPVKSIRALVQRLKGKTGRFRGNLSGKRVDFSGRTVISPDPNLAIDQVGVPMRVAKVLTFPERVTPFNIDRLRKAVLNGPDVHPGANIIEFKNGSKMNLRFGNRAISASMLQPGDLVERHLNDDDIVLFNRQPSLHRMSIMAHRAKVHEWRTLRFNECVCSPYNADFDGDEMNIHLPQTYEAKAEASELMSVLRNLVTPRHGEPLITATQDFLTGSFLMTSKNRFITRSQFVQFLGMMDDGGEMGNQRIIIPVPAILKPMALWTGKQCYSYVISPKLSPIQEKVTFRSHFSLYSDLAFPSITIELRASNCKKEHVMDINDGYICIRNSEIMCGNITKDALGGSKKGLYYQITRAGSNGVLCAARFLTRMAKFTSRFLQSEGFSIGIDDVTPSEELTQSKQESVEYGYTQCLEYIDQFNRGALRLRPGCDDEQTLEALLLGELSNIRGETGQKCFEQLDILVNSPLIMAVSGSKGSKINISQMTACVGQQAISGSRIPEGFHLRTLPHFQKHSRDPDAKGFVQNSFFTGLTATEFFFHTMGGREGLVDTAVKTAETGYMQRRLMKALEDLCVQYDGSVRTSDANIVQFRYGDDGLDPLFMAAAPLPVNFNVYYEQVRAICQEWAHRHGNNRQAILQKYSSTLSSFTPDYREQFTTIKDVSNRSTANQPSPSPSPPAPARSHRDEEICNIIEYYPPSLQSLLPLSYIPHYLTFPSDRHNCDRDFVDWVTVVLSDPYKHSITPDMMEEDPDLIPIWEISKRYLYTDEVKQITAQRVNELQHPHSIMTPIEFIATICGFVAHPKTIATFSTKFIDALQAFAIKEYEAMIQLQNLSSHLNRTSEELITQCRPISSINLNIFLNGSRSKYLNAQMESGTAVGAIAGQSIGEPGTQMTLKTFHFAGVASMNITQGVPRIKEIINASKKIQTPIITAPLEIDNSVTSARFVKGRIETTRLGDIAKRIETVFSSQWCGIEVELDQKIIDELQISISMDGIIHALETAKKLKLKGCVGLSHDRHGNQIIRIGGMKIDKTIRSGLTAASSILQLLHSLKYEVAQVIIQGIPTVSRAVINDDGQGTYSLIVEGYDLLGVMGTLGVRGCEAKSNHIIEVCKVLGIEAARQCIINEINSTFDAHGMTIDSRHMSLLADIMTYRGEVLGITRFGIAKMKESALMLASFEKTSDHLFEAAIRGTVDDITGVSECIILGKTIPVGTGLFQVRHATSQTVMPSCSDFNDVREKLLQRAHDCSNTSIFSSLKVLDNITHVSQNEFRKVNRLKMIQSQLEQKIKCILEDYRKQHGDPAKRLMHYIAQFRRWDPKTLKVFRNQKLKALRLRDNKRREVFSRLKFERVEHYNQKQFLKQNLNETEMVVYDHINDMHRGKGKSFITAVDPYATTTPILSQFTY